jgi:hypothetical protein
VAQAAKPVEPSYVIVKKDDTLIKLFPKDWRAVCKHNKLADCDRLKLGQKIYNLNTAVPPSATKPRPVVTQGLPRVRPGEVQAVAATPKPARVKAPATAQVASSKPARQKTIKQPVPTITAHSATFRWSKVGASPLSRFQGHRDLARSRVLQAKGYNASEINAILQRFNSKNCVVNPIRAGDVFEWGSFADARGNVKTTGEVVLTDTSHESFEACDIIIRAGEVVDGYTFTRDIDLTLVYACTNLVKRKRPVPPPAPPAPPPVEEAPPPPPPASIPPPPLVVDEEGCDEVDGTVTIGFEKQKRRQGRGNMVYYGTASVDCHFKRLKDGVLGAGLTIDASTYKGNTRAKFGRYSGEQLYVGPSIHRIWDDGQDMRVTIQGGVRKGRYQQQDGYSDRRKNIMIGLGVQYNDNRYLTTGKGTETNLWLHCGLPISGKSSKFQDGKRTGRGSKLVGECSVGGQKFLTNGRLRPYVKATFHGEANERADSFLNLGVRVGAEFDDLVNCGVGFDIGLINGGTNAAYGCGLTVNGTIYRKEVAARAAAIENHEDNVAEATEDSNEIRAHASEMTDASADQKQLAPTAE